MCWTNTIGGPYSRNRTSPRIRKAMSLVGREKTVHQVDCQMFYALHSAAIRALLREQGHAGARHLLQQLGTCHDLFRSVLRRIANDEVWTSMPSAGWARDDNVEVPSSGVSFNCPVTSKTMSDLFNLCHFITDFLHCLSPLPNDNETDGSLRCGPHETVRCFS